MPSRAASWADREPSSAAPSSALTGAARATAFVVVQVASAAMVKSARAEPQRRGGSARMVE
jgi:hypothetical protein